MIVSFTIGKIIHYWKRLTDFLSTDLLKMEMSVSLASKNETTNLVEFYNSDTCFAQTKRKEVAATINALTW